MRSTFYGIEIGRTGINVSQKGLDVTGHNIANVDTVGYTRQRLFTTAYDPYSGVMKFKNVDLGAVGGGAHVKLVDQVRSSFLDRQYRTEQTMKSYFDNQVTGLSYVEALFEGEDMASLDQGISGLFTAFNVLASEPNDREQRIVVRSAATSLANSFEQVYDRLVDLQASQNLAVETVVYDINDKAQNIAELNKAIYFYELDGQPANDLRDKRNLLLDELSSLVDINYYETVDNRMIVEVAGDVLITHDKTAPMSTYKDIEPVTGNEISIPCWWNPSTGVRTEITADQAGGELAAHMDLRDSSEVANPGIPYFIDKLNRLAQAVVETVNEVHRGGYTHPASGNPSRQEVDFFDPAGVTAKTIGLSANILESEYEIAASLKEIDLSAPVAPVDEDLLQPGNQNNARLLYEIFNRTDIVLSDGTSIGGLHSYMNGIVLDVANTLNQAKQFQSNHSTQLLAVDVSRQSISGVSLDEEMTNLIKYQHAYSGSSRVITAMDEALDTMINRMGRVGL
jgi:flagellar hook-associated protein 1 FlgK